MSTTINEILRQHMENIRQADMSAFRCPNPDHQGKQTCVSIREDGRGMVLKCYSGCPAEQICGRLDIKPDELF